MLTSIAPKLYSEHLAVFALLLLAAGWLGVVSGQAGYRATIALVAGFALLSSTKAAFYPLMIGLGVWYLWKRNWKIAVPLVLASLALLPLQSSVHRGGRGSMVGSGQVARLELWSWPVVLKCGAYSLSQSLGERLFPEVENGCHTFVHDPSRPGSEFNIVPRVHTLIETGLSYGQVVQSIASSPVKYVALCVVNLLSAVWLDGIHPSALSGVPSGIRTVLWIFKVILSTLIWVGAILAIRQPALRRSAAPLLVLGAYILLFQMNVPGEQRYFVPLLPILYILNGIRLSPRIQETAL